MDLSDLSNMTNLSQPKRRMLMASLICIFKKELIYMRRDPAVLVTAILIPVIEFLLLGFMLDINVRGVETVVYDLNNTQESHRLVTQFSNTNTFRIVESVHSDRDLYDAITAGRAKVGIKIPADYSQHLQDEENANVLILIDGSNATITTEVFNVSKRLALKESVDRVVKKLNGKPLAMEARISLLFNPETRSPNFFLPGLIVFELPSITILLLAFSIAREREKGTMEQLLITPIHSTGMLLGKMLPYGMLAFLALCELLVAMRLIFNVPINGSVLLLMLISIPFILADLGFGLIVASNAKTQVETFQLGIIFRVFPAFYMSGYVFPLESSPAAFQFFTKLIPHRYYMEVVRGIILRGAGFKELWLQTLIMCIMSVVIFSFAALLYRKKI